MLRLISQTQLKGGIAVSFIHFIKVMYLNHRFYAFEGLKGEDEGKKWSASPFGTSFFARRKHKSINHFVNSFQLHYIQHHRQKKKLLLSETGECSFKNLRLDAGCIVVELSRVLWLEVVTWELAYPRSGKPRKEWGLLGIE